jgi:hypothetical protein
MKKDKFSIKELQDMSTQVYADVIKENKETGTLLLIGRCLENFFIFFMAFFLLTIIPWWWLDYKRFNRRQSNFYGARAAGHAYISLLTKKLFSGNWSLKFEFQFSRFLRKPQKAPNILLWIAGLGYPANARDAARGDIAETFKATAESLGFQYALGDLVGDILKSPGHMIWLFLRKAIIKFLEVVGLHVVIKYFLG